MADESRDFQIVSTASSVAKTLAKPDAGANPFEVVIDPKVRMGPAPRFDRTRLSR